MRIPSYLVRNRFGTFYFRVVFPLSVCAIIGRKETRKSLRTWDRAIARSISIEFQQICLKLFNLIISDNMKWSEVKRILDKVADYLFNKYVEQAIDKLAEVIQLITYPDLDMPLWRSQVEL